MLGKWCCSHQLHSQCLRGSHHQALAAGALLKAADCPCHGREASRLQCCCWTALLSVHKGLWQWWHPLRIWQAAITMSPLLWHIAVAQAGQHNFHVTADFPVSFASCQKAHSVTRARVTFICNVHDEAWWHPYQYLMVALWKKQQDTKVPKQKQVRTCCVKWAQPGALLGTAAGVKWMAPVEGSRDLPNNVPRLSSHTRQSFAHWYMQHDRLCYMYGLSGVQKALPCLAAAHSNMPMQGNNSIKPLEQWALYHFFSYYMPSWTQHNILPDAARS